jgi:hypothetical protein
MNVIEVGLTKYIDRWACIAPFTFDYTVSVSKLADFWFGTFGCKDERTLEKINVMVVSINGTDRLLKYNTLEDVKLHFRSYAFNWGTQVLRINFGPTYNPLWDVADFQYSFGICDRKPITVDGAWYLPVLKKPPQYTIKEDLVNYSRLAMARLTMDLINNGEELDFLNEMTLFNNDVIHYRLPNNEQTEFARDDLEPLAGFLVENIDIDQQGGKITGQDVRNTFDIKVPVDFFNATDYPDGNDDLYSKPIPLCFGSCNVVPAIATNEEGSGSVDYRVARAMTSFGTIQVEIDDVWTTVSPDSQDLAKGSFTLLQADARPDDVRRCRCVNATGEAIARLTDVIVALDLAANGIPFEDTFYDVDEWNSEVAVIGIGGFYLADQKKLYDVIKDLQSGCSHRFRYEFNSSLLRTIRLDDDEREPIHFVQAEEIKENGRLQITTDRDTIFAYINVGYSKNYETDKELAVVDSSAQAEVGNNIRQKPTLEVHSFLTNKTHAIARAARDAAAFGKIRKFSKFTLTEEKYLTLRVYDILVVELRTANRAWMGVWKCKVLSVSPKEPETEISVCLIEKVLDPDDGHIFKISDTGDYKVDQDGNYKVAK